MGSLVGYAYITKNETKAAVSPFDAAAVPTDMTSLHVDINAATFETFLATVRLKE